MGSVLKLGAKGTDVWQLAEFLVSRGYLDKPIRQFDLEVRRAVRNFQASQVDPRGRPLVVDGIAGPLTWWAIKNENNVKVLSTLNIDDYLKMPSGGTSSGRAALKAAIGEMKAGAKEIDANNNGKWVRKYLNGLATEGNNWCAGFTSWCYSHAKGGIPFTYSLGAQNILNQFRKRDWVYDLSEETPQPGDIVVWWRGKTKTWFGHIGLIHRFNDGILYTIEGNRGGFPAPVKGFDYVAERMNKLLGFGRVP